MFKWETWGGGGGGFFFYDKALFLHPYSVGHYNVSRELTHTVHMLFLLRHCHLNTYICIVYCTNNICAYVSWRDMTNVVGEGGGG